MIDFQVFGKCRWQSFSATRSDNQYNLYWIIVIYNDVINYMICNIEAPLMERTVEYYPISTYSLNDAYIECVKICILQHNIK